MVSSAVDPALTYRGLVGRALYTINDSVAANGKTLASLIHYLFALASPVLEEDAKFVQAWKELHDDEDLEDVDDQDVDGEIEIPSQDDERTVVTRAFRYRELRLIVRSLHRKGMLGGKDVPLEDGRDVLGRAMDRGQATT